MKKQLIFFAHAQQVNRASKVLIQPMTPTATRLIARLDERRSWFYNEWFFKWHCIGGSQPVDIMTFDGRTAHYGGIAFCGSARDIYWSAIVRGVQLEINEQFAWIDREVRNYNRETALLAIDECAGLLASFVRSIRQHALKKDRILRGDGTTFPPESDGGSWEGTSDTDIKRQADALKTALPFAKQATGFIERSRHFWEIHQGWIQISAIAASIALGIAAILLAG